MRSTVTDGSTSGKFEFAVHVVRKLFRVCFGRLVTRCVVHFNFLFDWYTGTVRMNCGS
jgi:hypothetical protein